MASRPQTKWLSRLRVSSMADHSCELHPTMGPHPFLPPWDHTPSFHHGTTPFLPPWDHTPSLPTHSIVEDILYKFCSQKLFVGLLPSPNHQRISEQQKKIEVCNALERCECVSTVVWLYVPETDRWSTQSTRFPVHYHTPEGLIVCAELMKYFIIKSIFNNFNYH